MLRKASVLWVLLALGCGSASPSSRSADAGPDSADVLPGAVDLAPPAEAAGMDVTDMASADGSALDLSVDRPDDPDQPVEVGGSEDSRPVDAEWVDSTPDAPSSRAIQLAAGGYHTCVRLSDGTIRGWGMNSSGQLGDESLRTINTWDNVAPSKLYHSCATRLDGTLWCWGANGVGQLGTGGSSTAIPGQVAPGVNSWRQVSGGMEHTCATRMDGSLWCWGTNRQGQLGSAVGDYSNTPVRVLPTAQDWVQVSAGDRHTCAIRAGGTLWCWGDTQDVSTPHKPVEPSQVGPVGATWATVSGGFEHACAIRTDGTLWCWGRNVHGQLGNGSGIGDGNPVGPVQVVEPQATGWQTITTGEDHSCSVRNDNTLWCWGWNGTGAVGDGSLTDRRSPVQVSPGVNSWKAATAGSTHTCGVRTDETVWCWGWNRDQQLPGISTGMDKVPSPVQAHLP
jgi:alpha-tubulin suppressor-like RCC1 family protein